MLNVNEKMILSQLHPFIVGKHWTISHSNDQQMAWYYSVTHQASPGVLELKSTIIFRIWIDDEVQNTQLIFDCDRNIFETLISTLLCESFTC